MMSANQSAAPRATPHWTDRCMIFRSWSPGVWAAPVSIIFPPDRILSCLAMTKTVPYLQEGGHTENTTGIN
jgi:hypothetical protein